MKESISKNETNQEIIPVENNSKVSKDDNIQKMKSPPNGNKLSTNLTETFVVLLNKKLFKISTS